MWCVPALDGEYIARMENVLNVLARPYDRRAPVVAIMDSFRRHAPLRR